MMPHFECAHGLEVKEAAMSSQGFVFWNWKVPP